MSTFQPNEDLEIVQGSTILVTGVSGMIGIHIADEALKAGFRVRGTVRTDEKGRAAAALLKASPKDFEYAVVPDMAAGGAFDDAMRGVSAAIHCASVVDFSGRIPELIAPTVRGTINVLEAAVANADTVRSVVLTSTSSAASGPRPGVKFHIGRDTWAEDAVALVRNNNLRPEKQAEMGFEWGYAVYAVSKIEAERAAWRFVDERRPPFRVNVTNPAMNWGKVMGSMGVSGGHLLSVLDGKVPPIPSVYMTDTIDDARIHLAAAVDSTVVNERIFVYDEPFNWHLVVGAMRKVLPDAELPRTDPDEPLDLSTVDNALGARLLKKWWGQPGYKGLEQTVRETVEMCLEKRNGVYKRRRPASVAAE